MCTKQWIHTFKETFDNSYTEVFGTPLIVQNPSIKHVEVQDKRQFKIYMETAVASFAKIDQFGMIFFFASSVLNNILNGINGLLILFNDGAGEEGGKHINLVFYFFLMHV